MRVAVWTPLPPEASGIADYNRRLLATMARDARHELTAVVRDDHVDYDSLPGVRILPHGQYRRDDFDIDLYHMGNNMAFHDYMLRPISQRPGVLVLHDPALVDFAVGTLGGAHRRIFEVELAYNVGCSPHDRETLHDIVSRFERTEMLMSRRQVTDSRHTIVHSHWAKEHLVSRFGVESISVVPHAVWMDDDLVVNTTPVITFGVFGNISFHKRIPQVVRAFAEVRRRGVAARLIIAGRRASAEIEREIEVLIARHGLEEDVTLALDADEETFHDLQGACDVIVGLRWPTTGETSGPLLRCFSLGKVAIVTDVPQNQEFADRTRRRVPSDESLEHVVLVDHLIHTATNLDETRRQGLAARQYVAENFHDQLVADAYFAILARALATPERDAAWSEEPVGVAANVIGSWSSATGLAEAGRRAVLALLDEGVTLANEQVMLDTKHDQRLVPDVIRQLPHGHPYPIDLTFLNVNEFGSVTDAQLRRSGDSYLVAMWYWELSSLPARMVAEIDRLDEIWVASEFVRDAFMRYTTKPIHVMPCVVEPVADDRHTRESLGLPGEDVVIFLVTFDANSTFARKNPYGAIRAFEEAFGTNRRDVMLVVKVVNLDRYPLIQPDLRRHVERLGGIVIESDMSTGEIASLIRHCDVYVSMHRSEGFGLGLAEAMYFGRPVIATANSGNMQFMNNANSCLVGYTPKVVDLDDMSANPQATVVYQPGYLWVEPDVADAAHWMRWLVEHPEERSRIGARAAQHIRDHFSPAAAGAAMRQRLEEIDLMLATQGYPATADSAPAASAIV